jgi:primary-amine oxidase
VYRQRSLIGATVPFALLPLVVLLAAPQVLAAPPSSVHPLEPLSAAELRLAVALVRGARRWSKSVLFPLVVLDEPPKAEVLAWRPGRPTRRFAQVVVLDREANRAYDARVDLQSKRLLRVAALPGVQPQLLSDEFVLAPALIKGDPRWQAALRKRGVTDFSQVQVDTWAVGPLPVAAHLTKPTAPASARAPRGDSAVDPFPPRLVRGVSYLGAAGTNFYDRPIEGVVALVDLTHRQVVEVVDTGVVPLSAEHHELDERSLGAASFPPMAPLVSTQPQGGSCVVNGRQVRWGRWQFRFALHPREGLVLYDVAYDDHGVRRPILYRGALAEMVVPYGDADVGWAWRNAFDEGEYGLGRLAAPLEPGLDAPAHARLFDSDLMDEQGKVYTSRRTVGLYERDGGILWKHHDENSGRNETRRARELVLFFVATIGNYDYAIQWIFHLDGTLEVNCDLSGIMLAKGVASQEDTPEPGVQAAGRAVGPHGHLGTLASAHRVAPNVAAPHHQHFFNFRLDLDIDGPPNSVYELQTRGAPLGPHNPYGNAIVMEETALGSEAAAQRELNLASARAWRIGNDGRKNALGESPSFALAPGGNTVPFAAADSPIRRRARFLDHHVWVTRYAEQERYAAGDYPNQGAPGEGLPRFVANDEGLSQQDLVLWYTVGLTHIPRPEEWPIMSVHSVSFRLVPVGFFVENPALDVPRLPN